MNLGGGWTIQVLNNVVRRLIKLRGIIIKQGEGPLQELLRLKRVVTEGLMQGNVG